MENLVEIVSVVTFQPNQPNQPNQLNKLQKALDSHVIPCYHLPNNRRSQMRTLNHRVKVRTTEFIEITDLVPEHWVSWFWEILSQSSRFTYGDNNRSMITAEYLADYLSERIDDFGTNPIAARAWLNKIYSLGQTYIDLEN